MLRIQFAMHSSDQGKWIRQPPDLFEIVCEAVHQVDEWMFERQRLCDGPDLLAEILSQLPLHRCACAPERSLAPVLQRDQTIGDIDLHEAQRLVRLAIELILSGKLVSAQKTSHRRHSHCCRTTLLPPTVRGRNTSVKP